MVMKNCQELCPNDESRDLFTPPAWLERMVTEKRLGRKTGAGFYKKEGRDILVLDLETNEYREKRDVSFPSLDAARKAKGLPAKIQAMISGDDNASKYVWQLLSETLLYSARRVPEISDDIVSVDRAMKWGFNWELGPFELWDALGVKDTAARILSEGREVPALVEKLLASDHDSFYDYIGEGVPKVAAIYRGPPMNSDCPLARVFPRTAPGNPFSLSSTPPSLGKRLDITVDLSTTAHPLGYVFSFTGPITYVLPEGQTLLTAGPYAFGLALGGFPMATGSLVIPNEPNLAGMSFSMQALQYGDGLPFALSNALDLVLGR